MTTIPHTPASLTDFPTDIRGLDPAGRPTEVALTDGDDYRLRIAPVAGRIGADTLRMLAYNGSVPGPTLRVVQHSEITVEVRNDGDDVIVRVRDRGPGIPENERMHLFERFFRGEGVGGVEGSGLGLAIVQRAASRSGGRVTLENGQRGGTTFTLTLPARSTAPRAAEPLRLG